jgi:hypothetical protein
MPIMIYQTIQGPQQTEAGFHLDLSSATLPQDPDDIATNGFLDTLLPDYRQHQFTLAGLNGFRFTDQADSGNCKPSNSSATDDRVQSSIENWEGSERAHPPEVMDNAPTLKCSAGLVEHL